MVHIQESMKACHRSIQSLRRHFSRGQWADESISMESHLNKLRTENQISSTHNVSEFMVRSYTKTSQSWHVKWVHSGWTRRHQQSPWASSMIGIVNIYLILCIKHCVLPISSLINKLTLDLYIYLNKKNQDVFETESTKLWSCLAFWGWFMSINNEPGSISTY